MAKFPLTNAAITSPSYRSAFFVCIHSLVRGKAFLDLWNNGILSFGQVPSYQCSHNKPTAIAVLFLFAFIHSCVARLIYANKKRPNHRLGPCSFMWCGRESNPRHEDFQSSALPTELPHHFGECKSNFSVHLSKIKLKPIDFVR